MGKSTINVPFSIAMLNYQRVMGLFMIGFTKLYPPHSPASTPGSKRHLRLPRFRCTLRLAAAGAQLRGAAHRGARRAGGLGLEVLGPAVKNLAMGD